VRFILVRKAVSLFLYEQTWLPNVREDRRSGIPDKWECVTAVTDGRAKSSRTHRKPRASSRDAHGNVLADGDCIILIKDLKLGGNQVLKGGTKSKPIRLVDGDHEIDCKMDGMSIGLKACFVKKA
jgi:protein PhnA